MTEPPAALPSVKHVRRVNRSNRRPPTKRLRVRNQRFLLRVVGMLRTDEVTKISRCANAVAERLNQLPLQRQKVNWGAVVANDDLAIAAGDASEPRVDPNAGIDEPPAHSNELRDFAAECARKVMKPIQRLLCRRHECSAKFCQDPLYGISVVRMSRAIGNNFVKVTQYCAKLQRQNSNFNSQKVPKDSGNAFPQLHRFLVLLLSDSFGVFSDRCRSLRGLVSRERNQNRTDSRAYANNYCRPVGPVSPRRFKRTKLDSHRSSLLGRILPRQNPKRGAPHG